MMRGVHLGRGNTGGISVEPPYSLAGHVAVYGLGCCFGFGGLLVTGRRGTVRRSAAGAQAPPWPKSSFKVGERARARR